MQAPEPVKSVGNTRYDYQQRKRSNSYKVARILSRESVEAFEAKANRERKA